MRPDVHLSGPCGRKGLRHLDTCQLRTYLHAHIPRLECPEHGVLQVKLPGAEPRSPSARLFACLIIDVIEQCVTIQGTRQLLRLTWDEVWGVMKRAVAWGLLVSRQECFTPSVSMRKPLKRGINI